VGSIERKKELRRRRHRSQKMTRLRRRAVVANTSEKAIIAQKIRRLTPGSESIIASMALEDR